METSTTAMEQYFDLVQNQIERVRSTQSANIQTAATWIADALSDDHWLYTFGTGHSRMLAEEVFHRAGGLVRAVPILDDKLMFNHGAEAATAHERSEGLAERLLNDYPIEAGDVMIVSSNSGRNALPIEMVGIAKARGLKTIAITNIEHSNAWPSRHSSGKKLADVADLVLDNCGVNGDACLELPRLPDKVGPTSTITGALLTNLVIVQSMQLALDRGNVPEMYISSNSYGDDHNEKMASQYKSRVRHL